MDMYLYIKTHVKFKTQCLGSFLASVFTDKRGEEIQMLQGVFCSCDAYMEQHNVD